MRPRHIFAAALMATSLVAVSVPAALAADTTDASGPSATTVSPSPSASPTPSQSPAASSPANTSVKSGSSNTSAGSAGAGNPLTAGAGALGGGSSNPLGAVLDSGGTSGLNQLLGALNSGSSQIPIPGLSTLTDCVQGQLTAKTPDGKAMEACFSSFFATLTGAPQAKCLDPLLQGLIGGLQTLLQNQDPKQLQDFLQGLPNTLQQLPTCLQGSAKQPVKPVPTTTESSGGATTPDSPTAAVPVVANPTFTG